MHRTRSNPHRQGQARPRGRAVLLQLVEATRLQLAEAARLQLAEAARLQRVEAARPQLAEAARLQLAEAAPGATSSTRGAIWPMRLQMVRRLSDGDARLVHQAGTSFRPDVRR
jgi:hypothetical protein